MGVRIGTVLRWIAGLLALVIGTVGIAALAAAAVGIVASFMVLRSSNYDTSPMVVVVPLILAGVVAVPVALFIRDGALDGLPADVRRRARLVGTTAAGLIGVGMVAALLIAVRLTDDDGPAPPTTPPTMTFPSTTPP